MLRRTALLLAAFCLPVSQAAATDYLSVAAPSAVLYDQPGATAKKLAVISRYMPLEVVVTQGGWVKVRDPFGKLAWADKKALSNRRYLMVSAMPAADVRKSADASDAVAFRAAQYVVLECLGNVGGGWLNVRHPDGSAGYIRTVDVWGE